MTIKCPVLMLDKITTSAQNKPDSPDFSFKNVIRTDLRILQISLVPDTSFILRGRLEIFLGNETVAEITWNEVTDLSEINLDYSGVGGVKMDLNDSLDFYVWNETDSAQIQLSVLINCGTVA